MTSASPFLLFETEHWQIEHRPDAALPGYLLMCAKQNTTHLWELDSTNLSSQSTDAANCGVASVLASSSINDTLSRCAPKASDTSSASATLKTGSTALEEMGPLLARFQKLMIDVLKPTYLYIGRYGHLKGPSFHFHFIPIYDWVIKSFLNDDRYRVLKQFQYRTDGMFAERQFDASELQLYVWREFCENPNPPKIEGFSIEEAMAELKKNIT